MLIRALRDEQEIRNDSTCSSHIDDDARACGLC